MAITNFRIDSSEQLVDAMLVPAIIFREMPEGSLIFQACRSKGTITVVVKNMSNEPATAFARVSGIAFNEKKN